jgi:DnaJ-class molecular chaperone
MTDHYSTLGVNASATLDEIKKSYRSLAMKHHPDRGGDQNTFKNIAAAYDVIGDQQKRAEYDQQRAGGQQRFHTGSPEYRSSADAFADIFRGDNIFNEFLARRPPQQQRNRDLNLQCTVSLLDSLLGKQLEAKYKLRSGNNQVAAISVPPGIENGATIRYQGMGDDSIRGVPAGNLNVTIIVTPDVNFRREGNDLYTTAFISPIEAMIGCRKTIKTLAGRNLELDIRPGVSSHTEFASSSDGFPNVHNSGIGRFVTLVIIKTPAVTDPILVEKLRHLDSLIGNTA